ncbi:probable phospholipid hydroperoxide glutathione peroxidase [Drosophila subobscura]|uniref:probable phospholipid hydroperoxide glutathione peroxidase n=1 Tax=Drosophila subobscura TaxID=7241 RepID=UPI00155AFCBF|nr:probable phospholipid hydroperoxide glutathione peroxidase [Drosophila subobscura]
MMVSKVVAFYGLMVALVCLTTILTHRQLAVQLFELRWTLSVHSLSVLDTYHQWVDLRDFAGHVLIIVNIASQCGLTRQQYAGLGLLLERYWWRGLRILNFPCNQFGQQMPESDGQQMVDHLRQVEARIGHVFAKVEVNGPEAAPLYKLLTRNRSHMRSGEIEWNFVKFLVDGRGQVYGRYGATEEPSVLGSDIELLLGKGSQ